MIVFLAQVRLLVLAAERDFAIQEMKSMANHCQTVAAEFEEVAKQCETLKQQLKEVRNQII